MNDGICDCIHPERLCPTGPQMERLISAAREMLLVGSHDGPCTNEDEPEDVCELHWDTSKRRRAELRAALDALHSSSIRR
jgi:hypothetical protein